MIVERSSGVTVAFAIAACCVIVGLLFAIAGHDPWITFQGLLSHSFGSAYGIQQVASRLVPILLCAIAAALPAQASLLNIGAEGQIQTGGIAAGGFLMLAPFSNPVLLMGGAIIASLLGGAAAAALPAIGRALWGASEALTSLFLNYVWRFMLAWLVYGSMRDTAGRGWPVGPYIPASAQLQSYGIFRYSGLAVAILLLAATAAFLQWTRAGFELRAVGQGVAASRLVGIPIRRYLIGSFLAGGMAAGLAGFYQLSAVELRLRPEISLGMGYYGFLIAWICRGKWALMLPVSILVSAIVVGSETLQITARLPAATADVFLGLTMLLVLVGQRVQSLSARRRILAETAGTVA